MWELFADITFEMLKTPKSLKILTRARLPALTPVEGKTILQYTGTEPREIELTILFHSSFCNPKEEAQKLKQLTGTAQPLMIGEELVGNFTLEEIEEEIRTTAKGEPVSIELKLKLKEVQDVED